MCVAIVAKVDRYNFACVGPAEVLEEWSCGIRVRGEAVTRRVWKSYSICKYDHIYIYIYIHFRYFGLLSLFYICLFAMQEENLVSLFSNRSFVYNYRIK